MHPRRRDEPMMARLAPSPSICPFAESANPAHDGAVPTPRAVRVIPNPSLPTGSQLSSNRLSMEVIEPLPGTCVIDASSASSIADAELFKNTWAQPAGRQVNRADSSTQLLGCLRATCPVNYRGDSASCALYAQRRLILHSGENLTVLEGLSRCMRPGEVHLSRPRPSPALQRRRPAPRS